MTDEEVKQDESGRIDETEAMARLQEQINSLPVSEHVVYMLHSLTSLAIDRLGLTEQSTARRDPAQARVAIDALAALLGVLESQRPAEEIASYRGTLSQLRMAYVGALGAVAPAASAAAPEPAAPAPEPEPAPATAPVSEAPKAAPKRPAKPRTTSGASRAKGASGGAKGEK
jgi:hypothetical protein